MSGVVRDLLLPSYSASGAYSPGVTSFNGSNPDNVSISPPNLPHLGFSGSMSASGSTSNSYSYTEDYDYDQTVWGSGGGQSVSNVHSDSTSTSTLDGFVLNLPTSGDGLQLGYWSDSTKAHGLSSVTLNGTVLICIDDADSFNSKEGTLTTWDPVDGEESTYTFDSAGRVASITDANGSTTSFTYDSAGNLASLTDPDGNTTTWV